MKKNKSSWSVPRSKSEPKKEIEKLSKMIINSDTIRLNVDVPSSLYLRFKSKVTMKRRKMTGVIIDMINQYVKNE